MGQTELDDDLFGEAAEDLRGDIDESLAAARSALPDPDDVWDAEADNVLGVLNGLRGAMDTGDAAEHLRDAKKWYTMGERADAFDDPEAIESDIEDVETLVEDLDEAREAVSDLAGTIPELRSALEDAHAAGGESGSESGSEEGPAPDEDGSSEAETASDGGEPQDAEEQATLDEE